MAKAQWFSGRTSVIPVAALADPGLKIRTKLVLAAIASFADLAGSTPAISKGAIAARAGLPATNLARELRELVDAGWLEVMRQPGAMSVYRLKEPGTREFNQNVSGPRAGAPQSAVANVRIKGKLADAPVFSEPATVVGVSSHGSGWLVTFSFENGSRVGTIFSGGEQPCESGDTAQLRVREWQGRKSIAGGAASGVQWLKHRPGAPLPEAKTFEFVVSAIERFATPAGLVFVSFRGASSTVEASARLSAALVPATLAEGSRIRVCRSDGELIKAKPGKILPLLDIIGDRYCIELI